MRLTELIQEAVKGRFKPEDLAAAVKAVKDTPEFQAVTKLMKYNSSERHEKNGTLMFLMLLPGGKRKEYGLYADGTIRYYSKSGGETRPGRAVTPFTRDTQPASILDGYRDRLKKLAEIGSRKLEKTESQAEYGFAYNFGRGVSEEEGHAVLRELAERFKFSGTVTVFPERKVKFTGRIDLKHGGKLDRLPVTFLNGDSFDLIYARTNRLNVDPLILSSLEGLPSTVKNLSLYQLPHNLEHFPKITGTLTLAISSNESLLRLMRELQRLGVTDVRLQFKNDVDYRDPRYGNLHKVAHAISRWLPHGKEGISKAQNELIDLGFIDNARF